MMNESNNSEPTDRDNFEKMQSIKVEIVKGNLTDLENSVEK